MLELIENQKIIELEHAVISSYMESMFGYYVLQLGDVNNNLLISSPIRHQVCLDTSYSKNTDLDVVQGEFEHLPFLSDSVDVVVARHVLEVTQKPHRVLQEIYRVLIPNGHLILLGFNPFSLLGVKNLLNKDDNIISIYQLRQWLSDVGLQELEKQFITYLFWRDIYVFVLQKKVIPLSLIGKKMDNKERMQTVTPVAKPTTRVRHEEN